MPKRASTLTLVYTEEAVKLHRVRSNKGFQSLSQTERCIVCTSPEHPGLPTRDNKHFKPGTTCGSALTNIGRPTIESMWKLPFGTQKLFYSTARMADANDEDKEWKDKAPAREDTDMEPVNYWAMSQNLCEEILWRKP